MASGRFSLRSEYFISCNHYWAVPFYNYIIIYFCLISSEMKMVLLAIDDIHARLYFRSLFYQYPVNSRVRSNDKTRCISTVLSGFMRIFGFMEHGIRSERGSIMTIHKCQKFCFLIQRVEYSPLSAYTSAYAG